MERISIHAPRTGSDNINYKAYGTPQISIHAPRTGSDANLHRRTSRRWYFNPRSPHGERPDFRRDVFGNQQFQSTLPARGATPPAACRRRTPPISIHAPRTGSDDNPPDDDLLAEVISIHAPRTGSDTRLTSAGRGTGRFQSTLPARGATNSRSRETAKSFHFNPRSPHGERRIPAVPHAVRRKFQSTLPARGATISQGIALSHSRFQSTLPARGATASLA